MRETIFSEDFLVLDYLHDLNIFMSSWYGHVDYDTCIIGYNRVKDSVKRNQASALLSDMSKIQSTNKDRDVQNFLLEEQHNQLVNTGLRFHAIILPIQWVGKMPEKMFASANDAKRLEIAFFESARTAGAWLKMKAENSKN